MISRSSFPDRELLELRAARAERGGMCPRERRGGLSGAGGRSLVKVKRNRERGLVAAWSAQPHPKTDMIWRFAACREALSA